jgi:hypothetical protein
MNTRVSTISERFNPYYEEAFNRFAEQYCSAHDRKVSDMSADEFEIMCSLFDYERRTQKPNN